MGTGHVKTFRSQKYKIKTTKPVPLFSRLGGTEFFECLNQFSRILNHGKGAPVTEQSEEITRFSGHPCLLRSQNSVKK